MAYISEAIISINPDAKFTIHKEGSDSNAVDNCTIDWLEATTPISKEDIKTKLSQLTTEYDAQDYARKRKVAYPDIYDYMDGIVKDDQTQINKYIADSQAVKARYPKGG